jgi:uracil-DNA glycosylase family 4
MDQPAPKGVAVVGEAPGSAEAKQGRPFVGKSGVLLDRVLDEVGLGRDGVAVLNTVACRPPQNRDPLPAETAACRPLYERQLDFTGAWIVVLVGNKALQQVFPNQTITKRRGIPTWHGGRIYIPTFHPAYILRNPRVKPLFVNDLQLAAAIFRGDKWWPPITGTLPINGGIVDSEDVARLHATLTANHWALVRSSKLEDDIVIVEDDLVKVPMKYVNYPRYTVQELVRVGSMGRGGQPTLGELAAIHLVKRLGGTIVQ